MKHKKNNITSKITQFFSSHYNKMWHTKHQIRPFRMIFYGLGIVVITLVLVVITNIISGENQTAKTVDTKAKSSIPDIFIANFSQAVYEATLLENNQIEYKFCEFDPADPGDRSTCFTIDTVDEGYPGVGFGTIPDRIINSYDPVGLGSFKLTNVENPDGSTDEERIVFSLVVQDKSNLSLYGTFERICRPSRDSNRPTYIICDDWAGNVVELAPILGGSNILPDTEPNVINIQGYSTYGAYTIPGESVEQSFVSTKNIEPSLGFVTGGINSIFFSSAIESDGTVNYRYSPDKGGAFVHYRNYTSPPGVNTFGAGPYGGYVYNNMLFQQFAIRTLEAPSAGSSSPIPTLNYYYRTCPINPNGTIDWETCESDIPLWKLFQQSVDPIIDFSVEHFEDISGRVRRGDCNIDGDVSAGDISAISLLASGGGPITNQACDANVDGIIDSGDAQCVVNIIFDGPNVNCSAGPIPTPTGPVPTMAPGPVIAGDCNGDREVDAGDVSALILRLFDNLFLDQEGCDANEDGTVNFIDLSCLSIIIGGGTCAGSGTVSPTVTPVPTTITPLPSTNTPVPPTNTPLTPTNTPVTPTVTGTPLSDLDIIYARSNPTDVDTGFLSVTSATEVTIQSSFLTGGSTSTTEPLEVVSGSCSRNMSTYRCESAVATDFSFQLDASSVTGDENNITVQATDGTDTVGLIFDPQFEANDAISVNVLMNSSPFEVYPEARYAALKNNRLDVSNFENLVVETDFSSGEINPANDQARDCIRRRRTIRCSNSSGSSNISDYVFTLSDVSGELTIQGPTESLPFLFGTFEL